MSDDSYTEVTSQSWFGRLGNAIKGVVVGLIFFVGSFVLLFWNEGRAIKTFRSLEEGKSSAVSVSAESVNPGNAGKLIHLTGRAESRAKLRDPLFNVTADSLRLKRVVEMYQWKESTEKNERKKLGGGKEVTTTYNYNKVWSDEPIDSAHFKKSTEHQNPTSWPCRTEEWNAEPVTVGAYRLSPPLVRKINAFTDLPVTDGASAQLGGFRAENGAFVRGNSSAPNIGDMRVTFVAVYPTEVSLMARQVGNTFEPYTTHAGGSIELLETGMHSIEAMIQTAEDQNTFMTWALRVVGFFMMFVGLAMVLNPLAVLGDVVPLIGSIIGFGTGLISFVIAVALSLITIAIAWVFYRPLVAVVMLVVAFGVLFLLKRKGARTTSADAA